MEITYPKWIIEEFDCSLNFVLGNVALHKKLKSRQGGTRVLGGGYYEIDNERKTLKLYGGSIDFGKCTLDQVRKAKEEEFRQSLLDLEWFFSPGELHQVELLYGGWEKV